MLALALGLASIAVRGNAGVPDRRATALDIVVVSCGDGVRGSWALLVFDPRGRLRLPDGRAVDAQGLTAAEILERWRGGLCPGQAMARDVALAGAADDLASLMQRSPVDDGASRLEELERCKQLRARAGGIDVCRISNGSRVVLPPSP